MLFRMRDARLRMRKKGLRMRRVLVRTSCENVPPTDVGGVWEGAAVVKEFLVQLVGGGALVGRKRGRAVPLQTKAFDSTMGFPGEDVAAQT